MRWVRVWCGLGGVDLRGFVSVLWWDGGMVAVLCGRSDVGLRKVCVLLAFLPQAWLGNVQVFSKLAFRYCGWSDTKMQTFRSRQTWPIVQQGISALSCRPWSGMLCLPCIVLLCPALFCSAWPGFALLLLLSSLTLVCSGMLCLGLAWPALLYVS